MCNNKKLLVLGGKPIGSIELVQRAKELGLYVIVTDFLPEDQSPAKKIADESWPISTAEVDVLAELCREYHVDGVLTAVHEFNINRMIDICERLGKPCYCKRTTWVYCDNKVAFKSLCLKNNIPVAHKYDIDINDIEEVSKLDFPVIVKPVDGSGSRGFSICHNVDELIIGYNNALNFSPQKTILVEDYIPYNAVIIHYTMHEGICYYSGMSDKISVKFESTGASVMGLQTFPSTGEDTYLKNEDRKVCSMFENAGFTNGPIWIEAFYDGKDNFIFNEMGYRLGGSLTNYPVEYFYGESQLDMMISVAIGEKKTANFVRAVNKQKYCILPIHIKPGKIVSIMGIKEIKDRIDVNACVPVHYLGDEIQEWGSAQQVFCYMHILYSDKVSLKSSIDSILEKLKAIDQSGNNMLYTLFDLNNIDNLSK